MMAVNIGVRRHPTQRYYPLWRMFTSLGILLWLLSPTAGSARAGVEGGVPSTDGAAIEGVYRLGPDDVVAITVYEHPDLSADTTILPDGTIVFPLLGQVPLDGLSALQAKERIRSRLERDFLYDPIVTLTVKEYRSKKVTLLGDVGKPGVYYLESPLRLLDLLIDVDGLSNHFGNPGSGRRARIVRPLDSPGVAPGSAEAAEQLTTIYVELRQLLAGSPADNIALRDGDVVYIPQVNATVHVVGEVNQSGGFPYEEEMTVLKLVTLAGGATRKAATKHIHGLRVQDGDVVKVALSMSDLVQPDDIVEVPTSFW